MISDQVFGPFLTNNTCQHKIIKSSRHTKLFFLTKTFRFKIITLSPLESGVIYKLLFNTALKSLPQRTNNLKVNELLIETNFFFSAQKDIALKPVIKKRNRK